LSPKAFPSHPCSSPATTPPSTNSAIVANTASASHVLKIDGYSRTKGLATGVHLRSCSFVVGGHSWHLAYVPNGDCPERADSISLFLVLNDAATAAAPVLATFIISLLDRYGKPVPIHTKAMPMIRFTAPGSSWGFPCFIKRDILEKSRNLNHKEDCFSVRCDLTVVTEFRAEDAVTLAAAAAPPSFVAVPPSDLPRHFAELLESGQGADVGFRVDGEDFTAHRCVFAGLQGRAVRRDEGRQGATLRGDRRHEGRRVQEPAEFHVHGHAAGAKARARGGGMGGGSMLRHWEEALMAQHQHLLVAADRYGMERLKLVCEDMLCRLIDVATLATTLALAEQHRCQGLKSGNGWF
ncbi:hypothetical protein EJB05_50680, partial [Eragrostis curvula]